jgi:hypothetical protein
MRYGIRLRSKYTGEEITLGYQFDTREEAQAWGDKNCCAKCNAISTCCIHDDYVWLDKHIGFADPKYVQQKYAIAKPWRGHKIETRTIAESSPLLLERTKKLPLKRLKKIRQLP